MTPRRMTGMCRTGAERDGGRLWHAVDGRPAWQPAACGAQPGRRGNGWSEQAGERVTCPRCARRLERARVQQPLPGFPDPADSELYGESIAHYGGGLVVALRRPR